MLTHDFCDSERAIGGSTQLRQQSHIEWLRSGITPTAHLERIPAEVLQEGAGRASTMNLADLVAYTLEALADVLDAIATA